MSLAPLRYACPWCGEPNQTLADPSGGPVQELVEDCRVCCRPVVLRLRRAEDGRWRAEARREGD